MPFSITIMAKDVYGNTVTNYVGINTLSDTTATILPTTTTAFSSGVWTGNVNITKVQASVTITTSGGGKTGTSNTFDVSAVKVTMKVSYSIIGGGSPSAPKFYYTKDFADKNFTLTTTPTDISVNKDSYWYVAPNPLAGSTATERWYSTQTLTGVASPTTIIFSFYHQYLQTLSMTFGSTETIGNEGLGVSATVINLFGKPTVTALTYPTNPAGITPFTLTGRFVSVEMTSTTGVRSVEVRVYYTPESIPSGVEEYALRVFWWNGAAWKQCSSTNVNMPEDYAWAMITDSSNPTLSKLPDTVFTIGPLGAPSTPPPPTTAPPTSTPIYPPPTQTPTWPSTSQKLCIIATAAYGSPMAPEVSYMRYVRDNMIGSNEVGRTLVYGWNTFYYSWSTPIAEVVASNTILQPVFRVLLSPLVGTIHATACVYETAMLVNPTFASIIAFLTAAIISVEIYIAAPILIIRTFYKRKFKHAR